MAKKKTHKEARVRYNPGGGKGVYADESLILETRTSEDEEWGLCSITPFCKSAEYPDAENKQFIHFNLINEIIQLVKLGYRVYRA